MFTSSARVVAGVPLVAGAFEAAWPEVPLPPAPPGEPGAWLLLTDEHPAALARAVALALALAETGDEALSLPKDDLAELPGLLAERPVRGVVFLTGAPHAYHDPEDTQELLLAVLPVVVRLGPGVRFHLVTRSSGEPGLVCLRGLVRVLAFERPGLRASLVDVDARSGVDALVRELRSGAPDDEVRWRHNVRYAARLTRVPPADGVSTGPGAYVITGGFGALGLATGRWLAENGASRIVLSGRSGGEVELSEVDVVVVAGDIAAPGVAERLVAAATADGLPLRGIVHAAGVLADGLAGDVTAEALEAVWRPKVLGARRLHEATADTPPDWWLMYSSAAALVGSPGQTAYATANAWLDAFAAWRRARGLPAATVGWGALADPLSDPMPIAEGIDALSAVLASGRESVVVTRLDVGRVAGQFPELTRRPFFSAVLDGVTVAPRDDAERWLHGLWREVLGDGDFDIHQPFPGTPEQASRLAELVRSALDEPERPPLRTLRAGDGVPLVLFHPESGPTSVYGPLLEHLGGSFPCHGFEPLDEVSTLEEREARYVELLREVQPSGPYRLGGWSFGGLLAFETAQRLTALGERVDVVVLVDSVLPPPVVGERYRPEPYAGRVVLYRARDSRHHLEDAALGWAACCTDLHVEAVPGDHLSMLDPPHVEALARHLGAELAGHPSPGPTPV